ncbi:MAG: restriction endonuclease [Zoogloeaceae bacterium]|jgi:restriction system protein|nr:restriction endonuclease [Zoogloeaceae bacterium]
MTMPKYYELSRPLLELQLDGNTYGLNDAAAAIAQKLSLSEADLAERVKCGRSRLKDRLSWAQYDLKKAGLLENVQRGVFRITDFGRKQFGNLPPILDRAFLIQQGWGGWRRDEATPLPETPPQSCNDETPDERIDKAFGELETALAEEFLERLKTLSPRGFEVFVVELVKALYYGVGEVTGQTGDGGIDGMVYEDRLHLDRIYLQAKRWQGQVGSPAIDAFIGAMTRRGATRGVFVTTSNYSDPARRAAGEVRDRHVRLIDGLELAKLAIEYNVGVSVKRKLEIKRLDSDYFEEIETV